MSIVRDDIPLAWKSAPRKASDMMPTSPRATGGSVLLIFMMGIMVSDYMRVLQSLWCA
jgi:hypothetical protein